MEVLTKLRTLIWDKSSAVWTDDELTEFLTECNNDAYGTAAHVLRITMGDPNRAQAYRMGGVSKTLQDLTATVKYYESLATGQGITSTSLRRTYK
jgi:hypothetical protein